MIGGGLEHFTSNCKEHRKPRGKQGDSVLRYLECRYRGFTVFRGDVLPGQGFAVANRMHAKIHNHLRDNHRDQAERIRSEVLNREYELVSGDSLRKESK